MDRDIKQLSVDTRLEILSDAIDQLELTVRQIDEAIRGNGTPGIQTRLALHDQRIGQLGKYIAEIHGLKRWVFVGVISLLGSMVWQAVQYVLHKPT